MQQCSNAGFLFKSTSSCSGESVIWRHSQFESARRVECMVFTGRFGIRGRHNKGWQVHGST